MSGTPDPALVDQLRSVPMFAELTAASLARMRGDPGDPDGERARWRRGVRRVGQMGLDHYGGMALPARIVPLRTRADASCVDLVALVDAASMLFVSGGKPRYLADVISDRFVPGLQRFVMARVPDNMWFARDRGAHGDRGRRLRLAGVRGRQGRRPSGTFDAYVQRRRGLLHGRP